MISPSLFLSSDITKLLCFIQAGEIIKNKKPGFKHFSVSGLRKFTPISEMYSKISPARAFHDKGAACGFGGFSLLPLRHPGLTIIPIFSGAPS
jgi:hypothetical protein